MSVKETYSIEFNDRQVEFLERMVEQYALPDLSKAVRILIDFAMHEAHEQERIFADIRCSGC